MTNEFAERDPDDIAIWDAPPEQNLIDRQREILSSIFDLIEKLNDFITDTEECPAGRRQDALLASFRHDAQTMQRILVTIAPLLSCVTRPTRELIEREHVLTGVCVG